MRHPAPSLPVRLQLDLPLAELQPLERELVFVPAVEVAEKPHLLRISSHFPCIVPDILATIKSSYLSARDPLRADERVVGADTAPHVLVRLGKLADAALDFVEAPEEVLEVSVPPPEAGSV